MYLFCPSIFVFHKTLLPFHWYYYHIISTDWSIRFIHSSIPPAIPTARYLPTCPPASQPASQPTSVRFSIIHVCGSVSCQFSSLFKEVFPGFFHLSKSNISKFQFGVEFKGHSFIRNNDCQVSPSLNDVNFFIGIWDGNSGWVWAFANIAHSILYLTIYGEGLWAKTGTVFTHHHAVHYRQFFRDNDFTYPNFHICIIFKLADTSCLYKQRIFSWTIS